jgi:hypothetical protein
MIDNFWRVISLLHIKAILIDTFAKQKITKLHIPLQRTFEVTGSIGSFFILK